MATKFKYQWGFSEMGISCSFPCCLCLSAIRLWIYIIKNMFGAKKSAFLWMSLLVILIKSRRWVKLIDILKNWWGLMVCIPHAALCSLLYSYSICTAFTVFTVYILKKRVSLFWQYFIVSQLICSFSLCFPPHCSNLCLVTVPQTTVGRG